MMFSPSIPRCPFFVSIFKGDYHPISSNIIPAILVVPPRSHRFPSSSAGASPAQPSLRPVPRRVEGKLECRRHGVFMMVAGKKPQICGSYRPTHMSSSFCSIFVGFDCFIPLWDNREVNIHNSQLFWLEQGIIPLIQRKVWWVWHILLRVHLISWCRSKYPISKVCRKG